MIIDSIRENATTLGAALGGLAVGLKSMQVWFKRQNTLGAAAEAETTLYETLQKSLKDMDERMDRNERSREREVGELREKVASLMNANKALTDEVNSLRAELHTYRDSQPGDFT